MKARLPPDMSNTVSAGSRGVSTTGASGSVVLGPFFRTSSPYSIPRHMGDASEVKTVSNKFLLGSTLLLDPLHKDCQVFGRRDYSIDKFSLVSFLKKDGHLRFLQGLYGTGNYPIENLKKTKHEVMRHRFSWVYKSCIIQTTFLYHIFCSRVFVSFPVFLVLMSGTTDSSDSKRVKT